MADTGAFTQLTGASTQSREGVFQSRGCSYVGGVEKVPVPVDHLDCPPPVTIHDFTDADAILQQRRSREMLQIVQPQPGYACRAACILERPRHGVGVVGAFRGRVGGEDIGSSGDPRPAGPGSRVRALFGDPSAEPPFVVRVRCNGRHRSSFPSLGCSGRSSRRTSSGRSNPDHERVESSRWVTTLLNVPWHLRRPSSTALCPGWPRQRARSAGVVQRPRERARSSGFQSEVFTFGVELDLYPLISKAPTG